MKLLLFSILFISTIMFFINHPLSMGLMILLQTFLISILSGMFVKTYWFSYILFLTFLGGLLVLFIYVSSIASNEMFTFKKKFLWFCILLMIYFLNKKFIFFSFNLEMNNFFNIMFLNNENLINLSKLYNNQTYLMMLMMMIYLFITLIAIIKVTNIFYGPLRPFNF
uniref:NADH-ubiquinone oxidoreductase chain 6 n=1 Tax=Endotricha consocia TaxID=2153044 RepID=A0A343W484_9NEOP|nr:NADH dehydrogenase subunit 6 [Endotricha consocia]AVV61650.1 NADH dehydrogenase subunit 6 [Endotricha consocia]